MNKDILLVTTRKIKSGVSAVKNIEGSVRIAVTKGFNMPTSSVEVSTNKEETTAVLKLIFGDGSSWAGDFDSLRKLIADRDSIQIVWTIHDVIQTAEKVYRVCSIEQARTILKRLLKTHDSNDGITWEKVKIFICHECPEYIFKTGMDVFLDSNPVKILSINTERNYAEVQYEDEATTKALLDDLTLTEEEEEEEY